MAMLYHKSRFYSQPFHSKQWERVTYDEKTHRLRVENGWLYKHERVCIGTYQPSATIVFVPDESLELNNKSS